MGNKQETTIKYTSKSPGAVVCFYTSLNLWGACSLMLVLKQNLLQCGIATHPNTKGL
jgi:hypothetical protein